MPFKALLKELVSSVEGATSALVLEADGEAVQWHAQGNADRLRLRAAYIAVAMQAARASAKRLNLSSIGYVVLEYDEASFILQELDGSYFLALELELSANIGQAIYRIQPAVANLRRVIAA